MPSRSVIPAGAPNSAATSGSLRAGVLLTLREISAARVGVTGTAIGSAALYERLADARRFSFRSVSYTHDFLTISSKSDSG